MKFQQILIFTILLFFTSFSIYASELLADRLGYYQVHQAFLNVNNCDEAGKPVFYASSFLRVMSYGEKPVTYTVSTCDGDNLDELQCGGNYRTTRLNTEFKGGMEGYYYSAREGLAKDKTPQCTFTALRRRVIPGKGGMLRYERTDWGVELADYKFECTREMAQTYFESQSMKCSTHIAIDAIKVDNVEK
ncbi:MAG: hypothetical protein OEZ43_03395 [Gammaproteobacteria bacterium]|nr:hypothetical protein [Gammaproteobacteria bacterium]